MFSNETQPELFSHISENDTEKESTVYGSRFWTQLTLSNAFPKWFPQIAIADSSTVEETRQSTINTFLENEDVDFAKVLQEADVENIYLSEKVSADSWRELINSQEISIQEHIKIAFDILYQMEAIFLKTGIVLGDRNADNIFIPDEEKPIHIDFGIQHNIHTGLNTLHEDDPTGPLKGLQKKSISYPVCMECRTVVRTLINIYELKKHDPEALKKLKALDRGITNMMVEGNSKRKLLVVMNLILTGRTMFAFILDQIKEATKTTN